MTTAVASIIVESAGQFEFSTSLADFQWRIRQAEASLLISYDQWDEIQVSLTNQTCQSGLVCSGDIGVVIEHAVLPFASVDRLELSAMQDVFIREGGIEVRIDPNATLEMMKKSKYAMGGHQHNGIVFKDSDGKIYFRSSPSCIMISEYNQSKKLIGLHIYESK